MTLDTVLDRIHLEKAANFHQIPDCTPNKNLGSDSLQSNRLTPQPKNDDIRLSRINITKGDANPMGANRIIRSSNETFWPSRTHDGLTEHLRIGRSLKFHLGIEEPGTESKKQYLRNIGNGSNRQKKGHKGVRRNAEITTILTDTISGSTTALRPSSDGTVVIASNSTIDVSGTTDTSGTHGSTSINSTEDYDYLDDIEYYTANESLLTTEEYFGIYEYGEVENNSTEGNSTNNLFESDGEPWMDYLDNLTIPFLESSVSNNDTYNSTKSVEVLSEAENSTLEITIGYLNTTGMNLQGTSEVTDMNSGTYKSSVVGIKNQSDEGSSTTPSVSTESIITSRFTLTSASFKTVAEELTKAEDLIDLTKSDTDGEKETTEVMKETVCDSATTGSDISSSTSSDSGKLEITKSSKSPDELMTTEDNETGSENPKEDMATSSSMTSIRITTAVIAGETSAITSERESSTFGTKTLETSTGSGRKQLSTNLQTTSYGQESTRELLSSTSESTDGSSFPTITQAMDETNPDTLACFETTVPSSQSTPSEGTTGEKGEVLPSITSSESTIGLSRTYDTNEKWTTDKFYSTIVSASSIEYSSVRTFKTDSTTSMTLITEKEETETTETEKSYVTHDGIEEESQESPRKNSNSRDEDEVKNNSNDASRWGPTSKEKDIEDDKNGMNDNEGEEMDRSNKNEGRQHGKYFLDEDEQVWKETRPDGLDQEIDADQTELAPCSENGDRESGRETSRLCLEVIKCPNNLKKTRRKRDEDPDGESLMTLTRVLNNSSDNQRIRDPKNEFKDKEKFRCDGFPDSRINFEKLQNHTGFLTDSRKPDVEQETQILHSVNEFDTFEIYQNMDDDTGDSPWKNSRSKEEEIVEVETDNFYRPVDHEWSNRSNDVLGITQMDRDHKNNMCCVRHKRGFSWRKFWNCLKSSLNTTTQESSSEQSECSTTCSEHDENKHKSEEKSKMDICKTGDYAIKSSTMLPPTEGHFSNDLFTDERTMIIGSDSTDKDPSGLRRKYDGDQRESEEKKISADGNKKLDKYIDSDDVEITRTQDNEDEFADYYSPVNESDREGEAEGGDDGFVDYEIEGENSSASTQEDER